MHAQQFLGRGGTRFHNGGHTIAPIVHDRVEYIRAFGPLRMAGRRVVRFEARTRDQEHVESFIVNPRIPNPQSRIVILESVTPRISNRAA
jgi:hypothetical protein